MGEVFRATDARLNRDVAIKALPSHLTSSQEAVDLLTREAKAIAALSHPNILAIFEFDQEGGTAYVVTELLEGETLRERLREGPLPWRRAVEIGASIADALAAAHAKGIVHRDIKPENVFVTRDGVVKVLDFGLALVRSTTGEQSVATVTEVFDSGQVAGTVGYMSPEQINGQNLEGTSDIFSLGCMLYEMFAGHRPFQRSTAG